MRELNISFLEEYKQVDRFIKDANMTQDGVSEYIRQMELLNRRGVRLVRNWEQHYRMLKHVRWVRNQLVHEVGYDSNICERADYEYIKNFGTLLCAAQDPLAALAKIEREERMKRIEAERARSAAQRNAYGKTANAKPATKRAKTQAKKKETFWQKLKRFFAGS